VRALLVAAVLLAACTAPPPSVGTSTPTPEKGVLSVTALLDLSGPRANVGTAQRDALQLWLDQEQGKTPFPVRIRTVDVASSDAKLLVELRRASVDDAADAVIVGVPVTDDETLGRALDAAALPVLFTLPLPEDPAHATGGRWTFALAPTLRRLAADEIEDAMRRGTLSPSLVLTETRIDPMATALESELSARGLNELTRIAMPADGSVPPVVRTGLSVLKSVHCTSLASACASAAQAAQATAARTFFYLSYLTTLRDVADHRELAARAVWPGSRTVLPSGASPITAPDLARAAFIRAYGDRFGAAGTHAATAYDAASLLLAAARAAGQDERAAIRDALERITMPLIASTYAFTTDRHAGSDPDDLIYLRWTGSQLAPALAASLGTGPARPTPSPTASPRSSSATPTASARP
jgi:substrate-binding family protein